MTDVTLNSEARDEILSGRRGESVFPWSAPDLRFGIGAGREVGHECRRLGIRRALVVSDENVASSGGLDDVRTALAREGIGFEVWTGAQTEPTEASILRAIQTVAGIGFDGVVAVGGGSVIDTAKLINLLTTCGGEFREYVAPPHGPGRPVDGPLMPMIAMPTTAGTGSECTSVAMVDLDVSHVKAAVSYPGLRPDLAIIDPLNTVTCPPSVTASAGYDAVVQALESLTSLPYDQRPPRSSPADRPRYSGANPVTSMWCREAVRLSGRFLRRVVLDGTDLQAREGMSLAALCSRLGNAGVHIPHANAYAVAGAVRDYRPDGFRVDRPLVPHGQSVIVTAPAAFDAIHPAAAQPLDQAAELLGISEHDRHEAGAGAIGRWLRQLLADTGGPRDLGHFGLTAADLPSLIDRALDQRRLLACSPQPVTRELLEGVFSRSFATDAPSPQSLST